MEVILQYREFLRTAPTTDSEVKVKDESEGGGGDHGSNRNDLVPRPLSVGGGDREHGPGHGIVTSGPDADTELDTDIDVNPTSTSTSMTAHDPEISSPPGAASVSGVTSGSNYTYVSFDTNKTIAKSGHSASLGKDTSNPQNWTMIYKAWVIAQISFLALSLTFASSVSSAASSGARLELGGTELAGTATTGAFVVGIGFGAMPFAPLSECESTGQSRPLARIELYFHFVGTVRTKTTLSGGSS
jgi:hypothetical protein